jgi:hypothetical protein
VRTKHGLARCARKWPLPAQRERVLLRQVPEYGGHSNGRFLRSLKGRLWADNCPTQPVAANDPQRAASMMKSAGCFHGCNGHSLLRVAA